VSQIVSQPLLFGGASSQPDHIMPPGFVRSAVNVLFSPVDGVRRRNGTWVVGMVCFDEPADSGPFPAANNRIHGVVIDGDRYLVVHNRTAAAGGTLRVFDLQTNLWADVDVTADAQTYLDVLASPDAFVFRPLDDLTLIINRDAPTGTVITDTDEATRAPDPTKMPVKMVRQYRGGTGTISGNTVANPTVVSSSNHGLVTGQTITISGSDSTPSLDGDHVVTVTGVNTFTVNVNVTVAGTTGSWTALSHFDVDVIDWAARGSRGDATTNPTPTIWADELQIRDAVYHRGRLVLVGGSRLFATQALELFDIWIDDPSNPTEEDPIDVPVAAGDGAEQVRIDYLVPIRKSLLLFAASGRQFELASTDLLSAETIKIVPFARYKTLDVRPEAMDPLVFFVSARGCFGQVWQYTYDEVALPSSAEDVTSHVPDLIDLAALDPDTHYPGRVRVIAPSADAQVVLFMRRDQVIGGGNVSDTIYAYSPWFTPGGDQIQRAWSELTIEGVRSIHDLTVIGDTAYMLAHCTDADSGIVAWYILAMKLTDESECDEPDAPVFTCTGAGLGGSGEEDEA